MSLILVTPPAALPLSLAEIRAQARIADDDHDEDALLIGYQRAAVEMLDGPGGFLGMALITQEWELRADYNWNGWHGRNGRYAWNGWCGPDPWYRSIEIPLPPLQEIVSVGFVDTAGDVQTLDPASYQVVGLNDWRNRARIVPAYGQTWTAPRTQPESVIVRFVAGFGDTHNDIPEAIRHAILLWVSEMYCDREGEMDMPPAVKTLLSRYRVDLSLA